MRASDVGLVRGECGGRTLSSLEVVVCVCQWCVCVCVSCVSRRCPILQKEKVRCGFHERTPDRCIMSAAPLLLHGK